MVPPLNKKINSNAKINLYLDVVGKDPLDSYHFIESVFQEIDLCDTIGIHTSDKDEVIFLPAIDTDNSTVHQALSLFKRHFGINESYRIEVSKNIPMGAGLGGGSSNAASVLVTLADHYGISHKDLRGIAADIGSDVPFFLYGGMAHVFGKGERVEIMDARLQCIYFLVVYPGIHVSTPWAYSLIDKYGDKDRINKFLKISDAKFDFLKELVYNSFQHFVLKSLQGLNRIKQQLDRVVHTPLSFMSGSGSSLVYVYSDRILADQDRKLIEAQVDFPHFLCQPFYR